MLCLASTGAGGSGALGGGGDDARGGSGRVTGEGADGGMGGAPPADTDGDTVPDLEDNCVEVSNPMQENLDQDDLGDACDDDIDGDGALNDDDCEPTDATIFPGAPDVCDGVDTDCRVGHCTLPMGAGQLVQDIVCDASIGTCAVTTDSMSGLGKVIAIDFRDERLAPVEFEIYGDPRGVGIDALDPVAPHFYVVDTAGDPNHLRVRFDAGAIEIDAGSRLAPLLLWSPSGAMGAALTMSTVAMEAFDPRKVRGSSKAAPICSDQDAECKTVAFDPVAFQAVEKAPRVAVEMRQLDKASSAFAYCAFKDTRAIGILAIDSGLEPISSGLLDTLVDAPSSLLLSADQAFLYVFGAAATGSAVQTATSFASHVAPSETFVTPAAFSDGLVLGDRLYLATSDTGAIYTATDGGGTLTFDAETLVIPGCAGVTSLGALPAPSGPTENFAWLVAACRDSSALRIFGSD